MTADNSLSVTNMVVIIAGMLVTIVDMLVTIVGILITLVVAGNINTSRKAKPTKKKKSRKRKSRSPAAGPNDISLPAQGRRRSRPKEKK